MLSTNKQQYIMRYRSLYGSELCVPVVYCLAYNVGPTFLCDYFRQQFSPIIRP